MRVLFLGTPSFAVPTLRSLAAEGHEIPAVITRPDRPRGRHGAPVPPEVKREAIRLGIPVRQPRRVNRDDTLDLVREIRPEAVVVVAFGSILSPEFLAIPRRGCINLHGSILPRYRGAAPIQWAVARGETLTGLTTMQMDEGLDTGPILLQEEVAIAPEEDAAELAQRLAERGGPLMVRTLEGLARGTLRPRPQPVEGASLAPLLRREDGRVEWARPAAAIACQVRGMQPWPVAHTRAAGGWLRIHRATAAEAPGTAPPGTVLGVHGDAALVACGTGSGLALRQVQPESRRRMSGRDAILGRLLRAGELLA